MLNYRRKYYEKKLKILAIDNSPDGSIIDSRAFGDIWTGIDPEHVLRFATSAELIEKLKNKIKNYDSEGECGQCIKKLTIVAHGWEATGYIAEVAVTHSILTAPPMLRQRDVIKVLDDIKGLLCRDATINFAMCYTGDGEEGDKLGQALANYFDSAIVLQQGQRSSILVYSIWNIFYKYPFKIKFFTPIGKNENK
ncbi:hypothetical protein [Victivallis sp. Marseille-Q1083]|uniref:hypothetical protein n=1 Tax=Victivallis sp. Marseille-Q1083 TaxID=2717288 RepID=UPI00158D0612|nr:hypothetical protein [Victivallis sp. Marseille-Q1083]